MGVILQEDIKGNNYIQRAKINFHLLFDNLLHRNIISVYNV